MQGVHFQCLEVSPNVLGPGIWNRKETKWPHYRKFESAFISWGIKINEISFTEMIHRNYSLKGDTGVTADLDPAALYTADFIPLPPLADINPKIILGVRFPLSLQNRRNFYAFFGRNGGASHARGVRTPLKIFFFLCSSLIALLALRARRAFFSNRL